MLNLPKPAGPDAILRQANERLARRDAKGAAVLFRQVLAADRHHPAALQGLGILRLHEKRYAEASRLLRDALRRNGSSAELHNLLGFALTGMEKFVEAARCYEEALRLRPGIAAFLSNLGHALHRLGRQEEALARLDEALAIAPDHAEALNNRGNVLAALGRLAEATAAYDRAVCLNPALAEARSNLAQILADQGFGTGRDEPALAAPVDAAMLCEIGDIYLEAENYPLARQVFTRSRILDSGNITARIGLARSLQGLGDTAGARNLFEELMRQGVATPEIVISLSNLPPAPANVAELAALERLEASVDASLRPVLGFARARLLHNLGRHREAWELLCALNAPLWKERRREHEADRKAQAAMLARLQAHEPRSPADDPDYPVSLFILGTSRSGKTALETLLGSVEGIGRSFESPLLTYAARAARALSGKPSEAKLDELSPQARQIYFDTLRRLKIDAPVLSTTEPGLIGRIEWVVATVPNSRFVFIKRDADDTVLRMLMKHYRGRHPYAYHARAAYQHVEWYHAMIDAFVNKCPDICRIVTYEQMVADPLPVLRDTAGLCGLPQTAPPRRVTVSRDDRGCAAPYLQWLREAATQG